MKVIIGGKEFEIRMTMRDLELLGKELEKLKTDNNGGIIPWQYRNFVFKVTYRCLKRRFLFKPFISANSIKRHTTYSEFKALDNAFAQLFKGEDEASGNA
ncbi:MAG: hypothetical protein ACRCUT_07825 [Spirochaetota bacterium]